MLLAIDAGNTNIVFALIDGGKIRSRWRIATDARRTADEYAVWLHQLLALDGHGRDAVDAVIIATVVPRALHNLEVLAQKYFGVDPLVAGRAPAEWGITLDVAEPQSVGADRAVNVIAAHQLHPGDLIVIDFGTATTFDVVDANGDYRGGVIAPGITLSVEALHMAAAKLPKVDVIRPKSDKVVATSTVTAMQSGIFWGYVGLIEGLVARIRAELGGPSSEQPARVIATGGLATLFADATQAIDAIDEDLTLRGLVLLHRRNTQNAAVAA